MPVGWRGGRAGPRQWRLRAAAIMQGMRASCRQLLAASRLRSSVFRNRCCYRACAMLLPRLWREATAAFQAPPMSCRLHPAAAATTACVAGSGCHHCACATLCLRCALLLSPACLSLACSHRTRPPRHGNALATAAAAPQLPLLLLLLLLLLLPL
jgi:hypothetical protein